MFMIEVCSLELWVLTSALAVLGWRTWTGICQRFQKLAISVSLGCSRQTDQDQIITLGAWRGNWPLPVPLIRGCVALLGVVISHCKVNLAPISSSPGGTSEQCAMKQWYPLGTFLPPLSSTFYSFHGSTSAQWSSAFAAKHTHTGFLPLRFFAIDLAIILF